MKRLQIKEYKVFHIFNILIELVGNEEIKEIVVAC